MIWMLVSNDSLTDAWSLLFLLTLLQHHCLPLGPGWLHILTTQTKWTSTFLLQKIDHIVLDGWAMGRQPTNNAARVKGDGGKGVIERGDEKGEMERGGLVK